MALKLDMTQAGVSKMLLRESISRNVIKKLSGSYGVPEIWIINGTGEMFAEKQTEQKNIAPTMSSEHIWRDMAVSQQATIADLAKSLRIANEKIFNLLSAEISPSTEIKKSVK